MKASEIKNTVVRLLLRGASRTKPITERETSTHGDFEFLRGKIGGMGNCIQAMVQSD